MANPILGDFVSFDFSDDEIETIRQFTALQLFWFQTEKAKIASEKLRLVCDPKNPEDFRLAHAYQHGKLDFADIILSFAKGEAPKEEEDSNNQSQSQQPTQG